MELDDSAFFRTQSYITETCYFKFLPNLLFGCQKPFFSPVQSNILPNYIAPLWTFYSKDPPICPNSHEHDEKLTKIEIGQIEVDSNIAQNHSSST